MPLSCKGGEKYRHGFVTKRVYQGYRPPHFMTNRLTFIKDTEMAKETVWRALPVKHFE
jgi:hypothetical protein